MIPVSQLLSLSIVRLKNIAWETVAPIFACSIRLLMMTFPIFFAWRHSHASSDLVPKLDVPCDTCRREVPQYCETMVSITRHLNAGIIRSCLICMISHLPVHSGLRLTFLAHFRTRVWLRERVGLNHVAPVQAVIGCEGTC
jgi:hypothetical protein